MEGDRGGGLGRSLQDVLEGTRPGEPGRFGSLFSTTPGDEDGLALLLDAVTGAFAGDLCGSCSNPADAPSSVRLRGPAGDLAEVWAITDALRAVVGSGDAAPCESTGTSIWIIAVPVGASGAIAVLRTGGPLLAPERDLLGALVRLSAR